jgi:hypothetical protein
LKHYVGPTKDKSTLSLLSAPAVRGPIAELYRCGARGGKLERGLGSLVSAPERPFVVRSVTKNVGFSVTSGSI